PLHLDGQQVWARQFNPENMGTKVRNDSGTFWCLGLKTEKAGTVVETKNGGKTEVLGGYFYYNRGNPGGASPVVNNDSSVVVIATLTGAGGTMVEETRGGERKSTSQWPLMYVGRAD